LKSRLLKNLNGTLQEVMVSFFLQKMITGEESV
jgi:hypothetical protein